MAVQNNVTNQNEVASSVHTQSVTPFTTFVGSGALASSTGLGNTALGYQAGNLLTSGQQSTAIGYLALSKLTTNSQCTAVGYRCLISATGADNTAVGYDSGGSVSSGTQNTFLGALAGFSLATTSGHVAIGYNCLTGVCTGQANVGVGSNALAVCTGGENVAIGGNTLQNLLVASQNTVVGYGSGANYTGTEHQNILIGVSVLGTTGENNVLRIGSASLVSSAFIAGIVGVSQTASAVTINASGQLGAAAGIITAPVSSHTATTAFGTSLTAGTAVQNTLGYDILLNISVVVASATTATLTLGVGSTATPTVDTVVASFSSAGTYSFSAIVPNSYYVLVNDTGTISITSITVQTCPL